MSDPRAAADLVAGLLVDSGRFAALAADEWDLLIRQGRASDLLPRLSVLAAERGLSAAIPEAPARHFLAADIYVEAQRQEARREIRYVREALARTGVRPIVLKGAAYVLAGLPAARGRVFSDLDILVPKTALPEVESALTAHGWATGHHDTYDQRYYRQWMHELPPFQHIKRETSLDVHHNILPETARLKPRADLLLAAAVPAAADPEVLVLAPADMVLHSMTHLFHNEELSHGLRDLSDIDLLLRHFGTDPGFWQVLLARAEAMDLGRPLYYGLRYGAAILGTPVPAEVLAGAERWRPPAALATLMDALWWRALRTRHSTAALPFTDLALFALYVRGHWLRMPPLLLAYHLTVKALRRERVEEE